MAGIVCQGYGIAATIGDDRRFVIGQAADDLGGAIRRGLSALGNDDGKGHSHIDGDDDAGQVEDQSVIFLQIRRKTDGHGNHIGKGIGHVLRRHELISHENHSRPDDEELGLHGKGRQGQPFFPPGRCDFPGQAIVAPSQGQCEHPGHEACQEDGTVIIPDIILGMFRDGSPQDIMDADELADKVTAMHGVHRAIPDEGNCQEQEHAGKELDMQQRLEVPAPYEEEQDDESRLKKTDRSFGQNGQAGKGIGQVVPAWLPFTVSDVKGHEAGRIKDEERHIGNDGLGQVKIFHCRQQDESRQESRLLIVQAGREAIGQEDTHYAEQSREKAGGKVTDTEEFKSGNEFPIKENRLVIPIIAEDARRDIVTRGQHFPGCQDVIRFDRVRDDQQVVSSQAEDGRQDQEDDGWRRHDFLPQALPDRQGHVFLFCTKFIHNKNSPSYS